MGDASEIVICSFPDITRILEKTAGPVPATLY